MSEFDAGFREWMQQIGDEVKFGARDGRPRMAIGGGEDIFYFDRLPDGWIRLTSTSRGGKPHWELDAATLEVAEVYVSVQYGDVIRNNIGFGSLDLRERVGRESDYMTRTPIDWVGPEFGRPRRMELYSVDGRSYARFGYPLGEYTPQEGFPSIGTGATWYIDKPLDQVLAALHHPTGAPLFELLGNRRA